MQLEWHPKLLVNVKALLERLEQDHQLTSQDNLNMRLKKTGLPAKAMVDANTKRGVIHAALRVEPIHGVKGESLDSVRHLADKEQRTPLVHGSWTDISRTRHSAFP